MSQPLGGIFGELGISQYLDSFLDQGFDTWETILDITESDLDALGVKLGHRRKLQRRIANFRGVAPDAALVSPTQHSAEDQRQDVPMPDAPQKDEMFPMMIITKHKRKYRRHPKPDENAPERPPSAYVLFSNKMREDLKDRNLSFTEIAKLVGENWQALAPSEKEPYETQAQNAKDKYNSDMAEYKKTPQYRKYHLYLHDFRTKHAVPASQDKDGPKRVKMSDVGNGTSNGAGGGPRRARSQTTSGSSSVDGRNNKDGEPTPPTREHRVNSTASLPELASAAELPSVPSASSVDDEHSPPPPTLSSATSPRGDAPFSSAPWASAPEPQQHHHPQPQQPPQQLPSLSNVLEGRTAAEPTTNGFVTTHFQLHNSGSPVSASPPAHANGSSNSTSESRPPSLRHEYSSGASTTTSSTSTSNGYPRTPIDGSMPIHLLLSGTGTATSNGHSPPSSTKRSASPPENKPNIAQYPPYYNHHHHSQQISPHSTEPPMLNGMSPHVGSGGGYFPAASAPPAPQPAVASGPGMAPRTINAPPPPPGPGKMPQLFPNHLHHHHKPLHLNHQIHHLPQTHHHHGHHHLHSPGAAGPALPGLPNLDGMSALLKAGEMVDREAR